MQTSNPFGLVVLGGAILGTGHLLVRDLVRAARAGARFQPKITPVAALLGPCIAFVFLVGLEAASYHEWVHGTYADTRWVRSPWNYACGCLLLGLPVSAVFGLVAILVDARPDHRPAAPSDPLGAVGLVLVHLIAWCMTVMNLPME